MEADATGHRNARDRSRRHALGDSRRTVGRARAGEAVAGRRAAADRVWIADHRRPVVRRARLVDQCGRLVRAVRRLHPDQAARLPAVRGRRARHEGAVAARPPARLRLRHRDHDGGAPAADPLAVATAGRVRPPVVQPDDDEHPDLGTCGPLGHLSRADGAAARLPRRTRVVVRPTPPGHVGVGGRVDAVARRALGRPRGVAAAVAGVGVRSGARRRAAVPRPDRRGTARRPRRSVSCASR